jgi:hypothetical protein
MAILKETFMFFNFLDKLIEKSPYIIGVMVIFVLICFAMLFCQGCINPFSESVPDSLLEKEIVKSESYVSANLDMYSFYTLKNKATGRFLTSDDKTTEGIQAKTLPASGLNNQMWAFFSPQSNYWVIANVYSSYSLISNTSGNAILLNSFIGSFGFLWTVELIRGETAVIRIMNVSSGLALTEVDSHLVIQSPYTGESDYQRWVLVKL